MSIFEIIIMSQYQTLAQIYLIFNLKKKDEIMYADLDHIITGPLAAPHMRGLVMANQWPTRVAHVKKVLRALLYHSWHHGWAEGGHRATSPGP